MENMNPNHAERAVADSATSRAYLQSLDILRSYSRLVALAAALACPAAIAAPTDPIRIGILHSQTGTMAISETPLVSAAQLAVDEINAAGGIKGRRLEPVIVDIRSDWDLAAREAERLLTQERVVSLFGCWTSACRKAVIPVLQRHRGLLWYPVQYEGRENSPLVIYAGATPNQQILPAVDWAIRKFGRRVYLVGSDYVFPRTANRIIREQAAALGVSIVGERYLSLGSTDVRGVVSDIVAARPDIVINTINGDTNTNFFHALALSTSKQRIPTISFSIAENEIRTIGTGLLQGNFVAWNYFQSLDTNENQAFVARFRKQFSQSAVTSDPIEAAYFQIWAFAEAASDARELTPMLIRDAALGLSLTAPGGYVRIDEKSQHTWKTVRLGEIMPDGQIRTILDSVIAVEPKPFANGQDPVPALHSQSGQAEPMMLAEFMEALTKPAQTASVALALRNLALLPWSADDRLHALLAAVRSPNFLVRYEAARAAEHIESPRREVIAVLLESKDTSDLVSGLRLLGLEVSPTETQISRAAELLAHSSRRVRLAAGTALLAQGEQGWRGDAAITSRIIEGFKDDDLGVQRNAFALAGWSEQLASRILPILSDIDLLNSPAFFRPTLCGTLAQVLSNHAATIIKTGGRSSVAALKRSVQQIDKAGCLPAKETAELHATVERAVSAEERGFLNWLGMLFKDNLLEGIAVLVVLILLALELMLLTMALILLLFSPAHLISMLQRMSPLERIRVNFEKIGLSLSLSLFDLLSPTWLKHSRRALNAWAEANMQAYRDAFERLPTVQARRKHVQLPVIAPGRNRAIEPSPELIRELVQGGRLKLHIVAESGTGKTSLACVIGRWAMSAKANERISNLPPGRKDRNALIAVLVEPDATPSPTPRGFLMLLQEKLELDGQPQPLWLVRGLIKHGLLLTIIDDVLEIGGLSGAILASPELARLWLIATNREELPVEFGSRQCINPQKLRGMILTTFFVSYANISGHADKIDDIEAYVTQFKQLLGADESRQETVVFFARLFLDFVFEFRLQTVEATGGECGGRRPHSVPELVENFVDGSCRHLALKYRLAPTEVVGLVRQIAHLAIAEHRQAGPLLLQTLHDDEDKLKTALGIAQSADLEQILMDSGLFNRPTAYNLRFTIDLVHEYCAVFYVRDLASTCANGEDAYVIWKNWVDQIAAAADGQPRSSGLLKATYECLRSDLVAANVPPVLLARVAELLGVEHSDLQPIRIGILHSLRGTMAMSEIALHDAAQLAVDEVNATGGIGGRRLEVVVRDGASDPDTFASEARRLIRDDGVVSIFGCWTSATRKSVKPVVESEHSLLWYPVQYEGYEKSEAIIYTGAAPNQQIIPAVEWCLQTLLPERGIVEREPRIFLVGSDYVFPQRANAIVRQYLQSCDIKPVGECYVALGEMDFGEIANEINNSRADVVLNTINGSSNIGFFRAIEEVGLNAMKCPVISLSIAEAEIRDIGTSRMKGHYAVWNYFQSLPNEENKRFVAAFQQKYGMGRVTSDPIATAYVQIKLFAEAAKNTRGRTREELRNQLAQIDIDTPMGRIRFDEKTGHFSKHVYIGQINDEGQFDKVIEWNNGQLVPPVPFPFPELTQSFEREVFAEGVAEEKWSTEN